MNQEQEQINPAGSPPGHRSRHNSTSLIEVFDLTGSPIGLNDLLSEGFDQSPVNPSMEGKSTTHTAPDERTDISGPVPPSSMYRTLPVIQTHFIPPDDDETFDGEYESDSNSEGPKRSGQATPLPFPESETGYRGWAPDSPSPKLFPTLPRDDFEAAWPPTLSRALGRLSEADLSFNETGTSNEHLTVPPTRTDSFRAHRRNDSGSSRSTSRSHSESESTSARRMRSSIEKPRRRDRKGSKHLNDLLGQPLQALDAPSENDPTLDAFNVIRLSLQFSPIFDVYSAEQKLVFAEYRFSVRSVSDTHADGDLCAAVLELATIIWNEHTPTPEEDRLWPDEEKAGRGIAGSLFRVLTDSRSTAHTESSSTGERGTARSRHDQAKDSFLSKIAKLEEKVVREVAERLPARPEGDGTEVILTRAKPDYLFREMSGSTATLRSVDLDGEINEIEPDDFQATTHCLIDPMPRDAQYRRPEGSVTPIWSSVGSDDGIDPQCLLTSIQQLDQ